MTTRDDDEVPDPNAFVRCECCEELDVHLVEQDLVKGIKQATRRKAA